MEYSSTEKQIINTIEKVRPFLQRDGGDLEYIGFKDGTVYIKMVGACEGCVMADSDISSGIEIILIDEVPGVTAVKANEIPDEILKIYEDRKNESSK